MIRCGDKYRSRLGPTGAATLAMLTALILAGSACAQSGAPIKIGYSMSLTGGLADLGRGHKRKRRNAWSAREARLLR
jgi:hypothetical protein